MFLGMAPDRMWGRFAAGQSDADSGALTTGQEFALLGYMERYALRRAAFELEPEMRTKR
jgi:hypothetical protein